MQEDRINKVVYKTIVVPADGSENSKRALQHAVSICERNEAQLIIVHVANIVSAISNFDQTPISGGYVSEQIAEDMEQVKRFWKMFPKMYLPILPLKMYLK